MMKMNKGKLAVILRILQEEYGITMMNGFNILGFIHNNKTALVELSGLNYYMWDNGGELGIEEINARYHDNNKLSSMLPFTSVDPLTMAYRIKQFFNNESIDYDFNEHNDILQSYLEMLGISSIDNFELKM